MNTPDPMTDFLFDSKPIPRNKDGTWSVYGPALISPEYLENLADALDAGELADNFIITIDIQDARIIPESLKIRLKSILRYSDAME